MFCNLLLTKDGFVKEVQYKKQEEILNVLDEDVILRFLNSRNIKLEPGFTLRSYFKLFENYPILKYLEDWVEEYLVEMNSSPKDGCFDKKMPNAYIQMSRIIELETIKSRRDTIDENGDFNFANKKRKEVNEKLAGIHYEVLLVNPDEEDKTRYAIEFTPINELLDVPLKIDGEVFAIKKFVSKTGKFRYVKSSYFDEAGPSFFDFITEIIYEISFLGAPENKEEEKNELTKRIEELESGLVKTIPFDEAMDSLSKKLNEIKKDKK
jgi:hypothetical protein